MMIEAARVILAMASKWRSVITRWRPRPQRNSTASMLTVAKPE